MRKRWWVRGAVGVVLVLAVAVAALWPVYVRPRTDAPRAADAILVLGGAHDGREELALRLAHDGYAPQVVFSDPYDHSPLINRICHGGYSFRVSCFDPEPRTTRGEGRELAARAARENWRRVIVVTFTPHISRARYVLGRCWGGEILLVDAHPHIGVARWAYQYLYQSSGYVKAAFEDC
ncbi:YdcF family protein [Nocardia africana]|uniref:YdcF family protein n=1 Tax=Nocardia africana TaxID=134964 RepID=UPI0007A4020D|nr:YdcF family protein [Nocardia africana]MCC3317789.1 YdcF family protein [Nocardia africana]